MGAQISLAEALTKEHHDIDSGIEQFSQGLDQGESLATLAAPLRQAMTALRRHIYLEEEFAFPPIREGGLTMPIMVMEREHGVLWRQMDALEHALDSFNDAEASPQDRTALIQACQNMLGVLESHNSKEEPIIYLHLDTQLSEDQSAQLRQLIETGSTPPGWVCARAGDEA
ncbi:MAG TPA: hemerythrin domain-containing protein [Beutenbergiaceae bacterium]|nr:hemerythrin domain-containing protein [Beutenbergiaceae bacterium]